MSLWFGALFSYRWSWLAKSPPFFLALTGVAFFLQDSLAEVEEKYKKAMVSNAQLDNEKTNFMYQVDTLKDALLELEEQLAESRRQYEEKSKVCKQLWHGASQGEKWRGAEIFARRQLNYYSKF